MFPILSNKTFCQFFQHSLAIVISLSVSACHLNAQLFKSTHIAAVEDKEESRFVVQNSITLGLHGWGTHTEFGFVDENGFKLNAMNTILADTEKELGLSDQQLKAIHRIAGETQAALNEMLTKSVAEGNQDLLEARFVAGENEIKSQLNETQLAKLAFIKNRIGIEQVGLAKYFSSSQFENPLDEDQASALEGFSKEHGRLYQQATADSLKEANAKLLELLKPEQRKRLKENFNSDFQQSFLESAMYTESYTPKTTFRKRKTDLYRILKVKNVRTRIGLSNDEYADIKQLEKDERDQVESKLTGSQNEKLNQTVIESELKRSGTVNSVSVGRLSQVLNIDEVQSKELHESGKEIFTELNRNLANKKKEVFAKATESLPESLKKALYDAVGDSGIYVKGE